MLKAYIAGPDVFFKDAQAKAKAVRALCLAHGVEALIPLDNEVNFDQEKSEISMEIFTKNMELIREADVVIANIEPFRGPSADVGTVWEMGCAYGMNKPVFSFTNTPRNYRERVSETELFYTDEHDILRCGDDTMVEDFDNVDNLMIAHSVKNVCMGLEAVLNSPEFKAELEKHLKVAPAASKAHTTRKPSLRI